MTSNPKLGISLMAVTMLIFAIQDGISQYLAREYNVFFIVMVRYWFFALFFYRFFYITDIEIKILKTIYIKTKT